MTTRLHHEQIYRGKEQLDRLSSLEILICGAGALGSNLASSLARQGFSTLSVLDKDRVEEHNLSTQTYSIEDIGAQKADTLANSIFREVGVEVIPINKELTSGNAAKLLKGYELVVDCFDNSIARRLVTEICKESNANCLHAGVNGDYGEVRWNERYLIPSDAGDDICDYPLARNLILLMTAVCAETIIEFAIEGTKRNYSITLADLSINSE